MGREEAKAPLSVATDLMLAGISRCAPQTQARKQTVLNALSYRVARFDGNFFAARGYAGKNPAVLFHR